MWHVKCDSASKYNPVTPPGAADERHVGKWCHRALTDHAQIEPGHDRIASSLQSREVRQQTRVTAGRVDQPFRAGLEIWLADGTVRTQYRRRRRWAGPIHASNSALK